MSIKKAIEKAEELESCLAAEAITLSRIRVLCEELHNLVGHSVIRGDKRFMVWPDVVCDAAGLTHNSIRRVRESDQ